MTVYIINADFSRIGSKQASFAYSPKKLILSQILNLITILFGMNIFYDYSKTD